MGFSDVIGRIANWKVGNSLCKGIIFDDLGDELEIICLEINGKKSSHKLNVIKSLCTIEE